MGIEYPEESCPACSCKQCQDVCPICESRYVVPGSQLCAVCTEAAINDAKELE